MVTYVVLLIYETLSPYYQLYLYAPEWKLFCELTPASPQAPEPQQIKHNHLHAEGLDTAWKSSQGTCGRPLFRSESAFGPVLGG